jgi:integrase/recombinase XerD
VTNIDWSRYPTVAGHTQARQWLSIQAHLGLANNTVTAYGRCLEDYLRFCGMQEINPNTVTREQIALYVHDMTKRRAPVTRHLHADKPAIGLANATMQQRLTVVRLFYDHLIEEQLREHNPVGRGRYTLGKGFGGARERGLIPRYHHLPWIPTEEEWMAVLQVVKHESLRTRLMFALSYDAGLRREELCLLETGDIDPAHKQIRIRAETTKNRQGRILPYCGATSLLYGAYLQQRRELSRERGVLFLSTSHRNYAQPLSIWMWSKVVHDIAQRAQIPQFTPHTLRHLCLTDLARAGWDLHEIAQFAGHRSLQSTLLYIHLSGRELAERLQRSLNTLRTQRMTLLEGLL